MNSKQKRYSQRYWKYNVSLSGHDWHIDEQRAEWLIKNFGRKGKGRRYVWSGWNPVYYQFHKEKDYLAFVLKWGVE